MRAAWNAKGFTITVVLTLAVAIGVNTATFAIVNSVLLRPLPVPGAERIVLMANQYPGAGIVDITTASPADYYDRIRDVAAVEDHAIYREIGRTIDFGGRPTRISGMSVSPSFFRLLQVKPAFGRTFTEEEGEAGNDGKVVLSAGLARDLFGAEGALGRTVRMDGRTLEVVGIMPANFQFASPDVRFWVPVGMTPELKATRHSNNYWNVGRLKQGATIAQAQAQVNALNAANLDRFPEMKQIIINAKFRTTVGWLQDTLVRSVSRVLYLLWGGAVLVLLIAALNVANLALARLASRRKEFATRMALGAGRSQLLRQTMVEHILLSLAGGLVGLGLGAGMLWALGRFGLDQFPRAAEVEIDWRVVAVSIGLSIASGALIALAPLVDVIRTNVSAVLHEDGRGGTGGIGARRTRQGLVAMEIGMAFGLLTGSILLLVSFRQLMQVQPGFRTDGIVTATVSLPAARYADDKAIIAFERRALEAVSRLPGVIRAAVTDTVPFSGHYNDEVIFAEGYQMKPGESVISPRRVSASPGFFETMEVGLVSGRFFRESDNETASNAVIVDERLARKFWPGQDPLGRRLYFPQDGADLSAVNEKTHWMRVVGVVKAVRMEDVAGVTNTTGGYYLPFAQSPMRSVSFVIRTSLGGALGDAIRSAVAGVDSELAVAQIQTLEQGVAASLAPRRASMTLATAFGLLAMFLAAVGIYGVLAFVVAQRNREIGIRLALGSSESRVLTMVIKEGLSLAAVGIGLGLLGSIAMRTVLAGELYGVQPLDPVVMAGAVALVTVVVLIAAVHPARRAMAVNPASVLRG